MVSRHGDGAHDAEAFSKAGGNDAAGGDFPGGVDDIGLFVYLDDPAVRPALWINLEP